MSFPVADPFTIPFLLPENFLQLNKSGLSNLRVIEILQAKQTALRFLSAVCFYFLFCIVLPPDVCITYDFITSNFHQNLLTAKLVSAIEKCTNFRTAHTISCDYSIYNLVRKPIANSFFCLI